MKQFIGTKIVKAEPQTCQKDIHNSKVGDAGYKVEYEDGYISWSPAEAFEKAYREFGNGNDGKNALRLMLANEDKHEAPVLTRRGGKHYEFILGIGKDHGAHVTMTDEAYDELFKQ